MRRLSFLGSVVAVCAISQTAFAGELAEYCSPEEPQCEIADLAFQKEVALPVQGGFDTGWVPANSPLQVHLFADLFASSSVSLAGQLETTWPEALTFRTPSTPGAGAFGIHYGFEIGAEAMVQVEVFGQTFSWTGPIPYIPQFDFQVDQSTEFDPWAFDGVTVSGETEELTLAQVSAASFIGIDIPGLDGGFELNTFVELDATYRTHEIKIARWQDGQLVAGGSITAEDDTTSDVYAGEKAVNVSVAPSGEVTYEGYLHLIPAFYIETIGPDFSIPIADIPIPFSFVDKNWDFDPVDVRIPLPDIQLAKDVAGTGGGEFPDAPDAPIDLGDIFIGESASVPVMLTNEGEAQLVGLVDVAGAGFSVDLGDLDLAPSTGATYVVTFSPSEAGEVVATLSFATNDPDEPLRTVEIHANGIGDGEEEEETPGGSTPLPEDGCDCSTTSSSANHGWAALLALGLLASRRRRAR